MNNFFSPLKESKAFNEASTHLKGGKKIYINNVTDSQKIHLTHALGESFEVRLIFSGGYLR